MKLSLVVLSEGKASGKAIPITLSQFVIGRDPQCHLRPASPIISKRHCALLVKGGKVFVRDFGSTNGTFVNDEAVKAERQLNNDDILKIGPLAFRVSIQGSPAVDKPTPLPAPKTAPTPPPARVASSDDESVADMLLSLKEDGEEAAAEALGSEEEVAGGTTVMDLKALDTAEAEAGASPPPESKPPESKPPEKKKEEPKKPASVGNTSSAAAAILQKYARRNRS